MSDPAQTGPDDGPDSIEAIDRQIAELRQQREEIERRRRERAQTLADPAERQERALRREQLAGRWAVRRQMLGTVSALPEIRELSGDEAFVWDPDFLTADGWVEKNGGWVLEADGIELSG